ncbi:MAG: PAS domain S-box protein [Myxococcota bacterium]
MQESLERLPAGTEALASFMEAAPDAIVVVDSRGCIRMVNRLVERMFGYTREELLGQRVETLIPERYRKAHEEHRTGYVHAPRTRPMGERQVLSGRRKNGREFPVEISLSPLRTEAGLLVISIIRDTTERTQAEAKFRGLLESAPDGIVVVNAQGLITIVNTQTERMFGYSRDELLGQPVEILVPERFREMHPRYRHGYFEEPRTRPMGEGRMLTGRKRDGTEFPVEISLSPLVTEEGTLVTGIIRDISERRRVEEQLRASLREKEVLLKEIHHRVKNNLQVTSSLLKLQSSYIADQQAREIFSESQNRIRSMALVHEKLYQSRDLSRVDLNEYTRSLAALLFRSYGTDPARVSLRLEGEPILLTIDTAVPCGLILNELLSNCLKHAFPDGRNGTVTVRVGSPAGGRHQLEVRDDGVGLPPGFDVKKVESLGLQLVNTLVEQIHGHLEVDVAGGTAFRVRFSEVKA